MVTSTKCEYISYFKLKCDESITMSCFLQVIFPLVRLVSNLNQIEFLKVDCLWFGSIIKRAKKLFISLFPCLNTISLGLWITLEESFLCPLRTIGKRSQIALWKVNFWIGLKVKTIKKNHGNPLHYSTNAAKNLIMWVRSLNIFLILTFCTFFTNGRK